MRLGVGDIASSFQWQAEGPQQSVCGLCGITTPSCSIIHVHILFTEEHINSRTVMVRVYKFSKRKSP